MTVFFVDEVNDAGLGSFRQAILDANANLGADDINFDGSLTGATLNILSSINITDSVTIDFDVDGDNNGDVSLFFEQDMSLFFLAANATTLVLGDGEIIYDTDEALGDGFTPRHVIDVTGDDVTLDNSANILASNIEGPVGDRSGVISSFDFGNNFTLINRGGASIETAGRYAVNAQNFSEAIFTTILNDGSLIAAEDAIRLNTGIITNTGLIQTAGTFDGFGLGAGAISDGISIFGRRSDSTLPVANGAVLIENTETGVIEGFRSGVLLSGGGTIENDGLITAQGQALIVQGETDNNSPNFDPFVSDFTLVNTGTISGEGVVFSTFLSVSSTIRFGADLNDVIITNSGSIEGVNLVINAAGVGVTVNNLSGGQIVASGNSTGNDGTAFLGAVLEDFTVEAQISDFVFFGAGSVFESAQGISLDANGDFILSDGRFFTTGNMTAESAFIADVTLLPLVDFLATEMNGVLTFQTDANGVTLFPPTIDVVSPSLGVLRVTFDVATGLTVTDTSGNLVFDLPAGVDFVDTITNARTALIDGDIITGYGDDVVDNNGEIIGDIYLGRGEDVFDGTGSISANIIHGEDGDDEILAGNGDDALHGGAGEDQLFGRNGIDMIFGGEGDDTAFGGGGDDFISGEDGADMLNGSGGADVVLGGEGNDTVNGGGGADDINGQNGDDTLSGSTGADLIRGGNGNDIIFGNNQSDMLFGNGGSDTVNGGGGNDALDGGGGADSLIGGAGRDELLGQAGNDTLSGGSGGDSLFGGAGDDVLNGGGGNDILNGGTGADQFIFSLGFGTDRLQDFEDGVDLIDLSGNILADDFADVLASATQFGVNVRIELNPNNILIIENFNLNDLDVSDFIF